MKARAVAVFLAALLTSTLWAEDLTGRVVDDRGESVDFATVVLVDLDLVEVTGGDGTFAMGEVADGDYTVLVIAPGFLEWEGPVSVDGSEILIALTPEVVEMDVIVVTADEVIPEEALDNEVSEQELERLPTRGDPLDAIVHEAGILKDPNTGFDGPDDRRPEGHPDGPGESFAMEISLEAGAIGRVNIRRAGVSVYGGESDWNNYYYDYIRIPTNTHAFGYPEPDAIVPAEAVDSIGIFKGVIPVEHGPAIGGLFTMEPDSSVEKFELTFTPSIMDISLLTRWAITDDLRALLSLNQSVVQYTVLPLIARLAQAQSEEEVNEEGDPTSFAYGDALFRLLYTPPNHSLSFDALAYYDAWLFDISFEDFSLYSRYGPYYVAAGSNWIYSASPAITNSLYAFGSFYNDFGNYDFHFPTVVGPDAPEPPEAFYDLHIDWISNVPSVQAGDELFWQVTPMMSLLFGANARLANMHGDYTEIVILTDDNDVELSNESILLPGVDEVFVSTYGYAKVLGEFGSGKYNVGAGALWYPGTTTVRPGVNGEVLFLGEDSVAALGAGWSPGIIDEFTYIDRRLDEQYYDLESTTELYNPPMAVSGAGQFVTPIAPGHTIGFSPYVAWYYDLSGIAINTSGTGADGAFISYDPSQGYSTGIDVNWEADLSDRWDLDLSYAFSWTRYLTDEWGWTAPNSEVRHALKSGLLYQGDRLKVGQNLLVYSGIPFTPEEVIENELGEIEIVQGDYNSAMDYLPQFDIRTNLTYTWNFERFDMLFFLNSSNWLHMANGARLGIDPDLQETVGTSSAVFSNREYDYSLEWTDLLINLLLSEYGLSFRL